MLAYAFLGGAFDPIHVAHIRLLVELGRRLAYEKLFLMPYGVSPSGKRLQASAIQRRAMIERAIRGQPRLALEACELMDKEPSYSYRTMEGLRARYGSDCHISFVLGEDCYVSLQTWKHWDKLVNLVNLVVVSRGSVDLSESLTLWEAKRKTGERYFLAGAAHGLLRVRIPFMDVSSSAIRSAIRRGKMPYHLLPATVPQYIKAERLYVD